MKRLTHHADKLIAFSIALASFLIYLRTLAPDVVDADGGEFQFAAWNFGFVHPTGYPLYLILGGLFQHLVPLGNPAFRLNLFTAITAALAVAMVYLVINEITQHRGASIIAAASFAITGVFWYDASAAETYALNAFFIALLTYIALRWQSEPTFKKLAALCFVFGLALTHHRTVLLWLPAFVLFFGISGFGSLVSVLKSRFAFLAFCFLSPLVLYLYIPLRAPASPYATLALAPGRDLVLYDNSLTGFINYFLGRVFQSEIGWNAASIARWTTFPQQLLDQFGIVGVTLGITGFVAMAWRREWARFALLLTGFMATILFASIYHIGDIFHYYIPVYLVWAMWIGYGIKLILDFALRLAPHSSRFVSAFCLAPITFLLFVPQGMLNFSFANRSHETQARTQWTRLLAASIPQNAILISNDRDEMMPLWYMQYVENTRRDVLGLFPLITPAPKHANVVRLTESAVDTGRPIYFIKPMPGIEIKYRVEKSDVLWQVTGRYQNLVPQKSSDAVLAERVRILGYDVVRDTEGLRVAVYWFPLAKFASTYTTFLHLLDARGNKIAQGNDHQVGGEFYPTSMWDVGETLRDEFSIVLPTNLSNGTYQLLVGMYRSSDGEMLGEPVVVGGVEIK